MIDILFLVLVMLCVPAVVMTGVKIYKPESTKKLLKGLTLAFLGLELLRFFVNASLYENAATPKSDIKYGLITVLCAVALFATFINGKFAKNTLRAIFSLTVLTPVVYAVFFPQSYINPLDVAAGALCKGCFMTECGLALTLAVLYFLESEDCFANPLNIAYSAAALVVFGGIDAFIIWYWNLGIPMNYMWFVNYAVMLAVTAATDLAFFIYKTIKNKKKISIG